MRATLILLIALFLSGTSSARERKKLPAQKSSEQARGKEEPGLFGLSTQTEDGGKQYFFTIADSLLAREFLVTVRYTGTPGGTDKYGGELAGQHTVYFQESPDGRLLMRARLLIAHADSIDAIDRAVRISNVDPIVASFKVVNHTGGAYKVNVTPFLLEDNGTTSIPASVKRSFGLQSPVAGACYVESVKAFPLNVEVRTVKTWTASGGAAPAASSTGRVTLGINTSFVLLPKVPMKQRLFDPRIGYFTDSYAEYADRQQRVEPRRFITRWRLEPKDSADAQRLRRGELVEPRKPITYYIDPATPPQWRPYLIQGVEDWQKAFEQAGFKNAIVAKEWPDSAGDMSMEDARYSCIRYLASDIENAYGPNVHDPRSGEILESHICWYHNVMKLLHDWYMIQAGTLDEAARRMKYDTELMGQLIRFVSSHEVGHTLGLRHNFGASSTVPVDSLRSRAFVVANGHTPSIMDYARFNYVAQPEDSIPREGIFPRIGDYDRWAIEWGYRPTWQSFDAVSDHWEMEPITAARLAQNPRLWFGDGETNKTYDARCQTEDLGDDAVKAGTYGLRNLQRIIRQLPQWTYESGDIHGDNLSGMYYQVGNQFYRYCNHVLRNIGAVRCDYKTVDQAGAVYTDEPAARQEAAFRWLSENVLTQPLWLSAPEWLRRFLPDPESYATRLGRNVVGSMTSYTLLERLTATYPAERYLGALASELFSEAGKGMSPTPYRMTLQNTAVQNLIDYFQNGKNVQVRTAVHAALRGLQRKAHAASATPFYATLADQLDRALVVK